MRNVFGFEFILFGVVLILLGVLISLGITNSFISFFGIHINLGKGLVNIIVGVIAVIGGIDLSKDKKSVSKQRKNRMRR